MAIQTEDKMILISNSFAPPAEFMYSQVFSITLPDPESVINASSADIMWGNYGKYKTKNESQSNNQKSKMPREWLLKKKNSVQYWARLTKRCAIDFLTWGG